MARLQRLALICLLSACTPWTPRDTLLQGGVVAALAADAAQTATIPAGQYETNIILGPHPSTAWTVVYFVGCTVIHSVVAVALPDGYRQVWQATWIAAESWQIGWNQRGRK